MFDERQIMSRENCTFVMKFSFALRWNFQLCSDVLKRDVKYCVELKKTVAISQNIISCKKHTIVMNEKEVLSATQWRAGISPPSCSGPAQCKYRPGYFGTGVTCSSHVALPTAQQKNYDICDEIQFFRTWLPTSCLGIVDKFAFFHANEGNVPQHGIKVSDSLAWRIFLGGNCKWSG